MNPGVFFALLFGLTLSLPGAELLQEWDFRGEKVPGMRYDAKRVSFRPAQESTPAGDPCGEFTILEAKEGSSPWSLQINFVSKQTIVPGGRYRYRFCIKADRSAEMGANCIQDQKPWAMIGNSQRNFTVTTSWQEISREFTVKAAYEGVIRSPMLMAGKLPKETRFLVGGVKLEKVVNFLPLALNPKWTLFLSPELKSVSLEQVRSVPETLGGVAGRTVELQDGVLDVAKYGSSPGEKRPAVLFNEFEAKEDGVMQIGCAADFWFEFFVNGKLVYDTLATGNRESTYLPTDHIFNFPVKKGRNRIAVRVLSGSAGWKFVCGAVPFREKISRITELKRGKEWRPVKMDPVQWKHITPQRIDQWKRIPGSALDLSQYVKRYDIDRCGRLRADRTGRLYFETAPGEPVRLRGFNFTPRDWSHAFYKFTHPEIEEFAEEIRLAGMNVVRFHFLDAGLAGNSGLPKQGKARKALAEVPMAQSVEALTIDPAFADRYYYLLKCLRDRGIYLMLDIVTSSEMFTGAVKTDDSSYARFRLFHDPRYRNHWKAGFDFLLKRPNPYTGKALIDDPQLVGITFFNEQEHLFNFNKGGKIALFTPEWRRYRNPAAPETVPPFSGDLLRADSADGAAARKFLRREIAAMNAFYLGAVKESGFQGFVTNWDMFMRNLEGDARGDFNAVAMHTYFAHPGKAALYPPNYRQRLHYGAWLKGTMATVSQTSSLSLFDNYLGRAAATRVLGKPFFMTEFSHCGYNRFAHEAPPVWAAFASLQDWQMLTPHSNTVKLYYQPFQPNAFDAAESLSGVMNSLFCAFGWQRGDIRSAKHAVSFHVPEKVLNSPDYTGAIGGGYNALFLLTKIGSDYRNPANPAATLQVEPEHFSAARSMGMWVKLNEENRRNLEILRQQVANLRRAGVLPAGNRTDVDSGLFESETGEIRTDVRNHTLTVDAPKFQAAVVKGSGAVKLSALSVQSASTPCTIAAISLENEKPVADSGRLLVVIGTMFAAENAVFSTENFDAELDVGDMQQLMRAGRFDFSLKTSRKGTPKVYALNLNGSRERELPVELQNGALHFAWDTSTLEYGTPYFEVVY